MQLLWKINNWYQFPRFIRKKISYNALSSIVFWEKTAVIYATFNFFNPEIIESPLNKTFTNIQNWRKENITNGQLAYFLDRQFINPLKEPYYGELSKIIWLEIFSRRLLNSQGFSIGNDGIIMQYSGYYYKTSNTLTFLLQSIALSTSLLGYYYPPMAPLNSTGSFYTYTSKLNPRAVEPHLNYWLWKLFAPINGALVIGSLFDSRLEVFRGRYFVGGIIIGTLNSIPITIDRIKYLLSEVIQDNSNHITSHYHQEL